MRKHQHSSLFNLTDENVMTDDYSQRLDYLQKCVDLFEKYVKGELEEEALIAFAPELADEHEQSPGDEQMPMAEAQIQSLSAEPAIVPIAERETLPEGQTQSDAEEHAQSHADEQVRMAEEQVQSLPAEETPPIADEQIQSTQAESSPMADAQIKSAAEGETPLADEQTPSIADEQIRSTAKDHSAAPKRARRTNEGATILDQIEADLRRHVAQTDEDAATNTLWVMHARAHDAAQFSPVLAIVSPAPGCGKTTLLRVLRVLTPNPLLITDLTPASLYRTNIFSKRTLLVDEAETALLRSTALQRLFNAGHCRDSARVLRGDEEFKVWCPKAIALIGDLPATLRDRSLVIHLKRKHAHEVVRPLDNAALAHLKDVSAHAARWVAEHLSQLAAADPEIPEAITNRTRDNWRPLIAIADEARGQWPERARALALKAAAEAEADMSPGIAVLGHIRQIFQKNRLATTDLLNLLNANKDLPWHEFDRGRPLTAAQLAQLLRPFGIQPRTIRFGDHTAKGYYRSDFEDAFERYL